MPTSARLEYPMVRVLVADDQFNIRLLVQTILAARGHSVVTADNGQQALQQLDAHAIEVLITDIQMPELDGTELIAIVRQRFPAISIIVISAYPEDERLALETGAALFLAKPFGYPQLIAAVNAVLGSTMSPR